MQNKNRFRLHERTCHLKVKATAKKIDILRQDSKESARIVSTQGAFGCRMKNLRAHPEDTSTRNALARILGEGEKALSGALVQIGPLAPVFKNDGWSTAKIGEKRVSPLPSNWGGAQLVREVDGGQSWYGWYSMPSKIFETAARRGGWMKAMGQLVAEHQEWFARAAKALAKCPSRGMNSPANDCWPMVGFLTGASVSRWKTPGHAFRAISHGIARAKEILKGFEITTVPWTVVMAELAAPRGPQRGHKLGRKLALATLKMVTKVHTPTTNRATEFARFKGFRLSAWLAMPKVSKAYVAREMEGGNSFQDIVKNLVVRKDDGVEIVVITSSDRKVRGCEVVEGVVLESGYLQEQTVIIRPDGRTYHLPFWSANLADQKVTLRRNTGGSWGLHSWGDLTLWFPGEFQGVQEGEIPPRGLVFWQRLCVRQAEQAWRTQDLHRKAEGLELPEDRTILVWLEDSYSAGNCSAGTQAFAERCGWGNRPFVPAQWLLDKEPRARAAAKVALARYWATQATKVA